MAGRQEVKVEITMNLIERVNQPPLALVLTSGNMSWPFNGFNKVKHGPSSLTREKPQVSHTSYKN
jgi:hypothetical protein